MQYTTPRVMTIEWIDGIKMTNTRKLKERHIDVRHAANVFVHAFGFQIFQTGFVHCDPHPGNVFVRMHDGVQQVFFFFFFF